MPPTPPPASAQQQDSAATARYSRQQLFLPIGVAGQQKIFASHAAVIGLGATGSATAGLLARAGVGRLTLIDRDYVEFSNLQRQVLYDEDDARACLPKAEAAKRHLARINASVAVDAHTADLVPANIEALLATADILLDCTDNFETRYLLNDFAVLHGKPWIYAAAVGAYAATMNILPRQAQGGPSFRVFGERVGSVSTPTANPPSTAPGLPQAPTACLACIFPTPPTGFVETCETAGILSTAVNFAASLQVTEALKLLTGQTAAMRRTLLTCDLWTGDRAEVNTATPRPDCDVCGERNFRYLAGAARPHITLCGRNSVQIHEHHRPLDLTALEARLRPLGAVRSNAHLLRFEHAAHTLTIFPDGRALIQGTTDPAQARSLYARFIGS